ncbi:MAG: Hint domain-containing protein [Paracoccaceae bacterium]
MPTSYTDQFWVIDPYAPPPVGTLLTVQNFTIIDQNNNNLINRFANDSIDGSDIRSSFLGDTVTVTLSGGGTATIAGVTFYLADGREVFTPTDGSILEDATLVSTTFVTTQASVPPANLTPICFTVGTEIETVNGVRAVETLSAGDLVKTADRGLAPILMVHGRTMSPEQLQQNPKHRPICIPAGALGLGTPKRELVVSPQHRILIRSNIALRMFAQQEILVPACQLVGHMGIFRVNSDDVVHYFHILLDHHAVVFAQGAPSETLFLGTQVHENLSPREISAIRSKLPDSAEFTMEPARLFVRGARLRRLLERHKANNKPLLSQQSLVEIPAIDLQA